MQSKAITQTKRYIRTLQKFDKKEKDNPDWDIISGNIFKSLGENKPVTLLSFTCSTINVKYMFNKNTPEYYVSQDPRGNNLEEDLPVLERLYSSLTKESLPIEIVILIGNTDPFYIYSREAKIFPQIKRKEFFKKFAPRWKKYKSNLKLWLKQKAPALEAEVISWYELEKNWEKNNKNDFLKLFQNTYCNIYKYFGEKEFNWELKKLKCAFGTGKYFEGLKRPSDKILTDWTRRKFAEYAVQGLWIKQIWPEGILIQNEKPTDLRYKMYQPLIRQLYNTHLPNIYPYGVDNMGFR